MKLQGLGSKPWMKQCSTSDLVQFKQRTGMCSISIYVYACTHIFTYVYVCIYVFGVQAIHETMFTCFNSILSQAKGLTCEASVFVCIYLGICMAVYISITEYQYVSVYQYISVYQYMYMSYITRLSIRIYQHISAYPYISVYQYASA